MIQGLNTQNTVKNLNRAGIRFVASAGGEIGTDLYRMTAIQDFSPAGYYDLVPLPMDGDKYVNYNDSASKQKVIYIRQDSPLPLRITSLMAEVTYGTRL